MQELDLVSIPTLPTTTESPMCMIERLLSVGRSRSYYTSNMKVTSFGKTIWTGVPTTPTIRGGAQGLTTPTTLTGKVN